MKLWSYQSPDFSLVDGDYCHDKSEFFKEYPDAYKELWRRVGCREIIWCSIAKTKWRLRCQWELEVPECRFLKIVDSMVWNGILGHENVEPGETLRSKMLHEAMQRHSDSDAAYEDYRMKLAVFYIHPAILGIRFF